MLYTNAIFPRENVVETTAGRLLPSLSYSIRPTVLVYELNERMEREGTGPEILVSSTVAPHLRDCSVVVSFALNCVCTPDVDLARRLTNGQRGLATAIALQALLRRFLDAEIWSKPDELQFMQDFIERLIGLPRRIFLGVMRALRTYVNAMHRVADDLELAYTLLVASVEYLAQDFDGQGYFHLPISRGTGCNHKEQRGATSRIFTVVVLYPDNNNAVDPNAVLVMSRQAPLVTLQPAWGLPFLALQKH